MARKTTSSSKRSSAGAGSSGGASRARKAPKPTTRAKRAPGASTTTKDFGIPSLEANEQSRRGGGRRVGASEDPGTHGRSQGPGQRVSGVGGRAAGPGSSSGGDIDPDIVGVGTGGSGLAQSAPGAVTTGPASSTGGSEEFASGPPARGKGNLPPGKVGGKRSVRGTTHDRSTSPANTGFSGAYEEEPARKIREASNDLARDRRRDR